MKSNIEIFFLDGLSNANKVEAIKIFIRSNKLEDDVSRLLSSEWIIHWMENPFIEFLEWTECDYSKIIGIVIATPSGELTQLSLVFLSPKWSDSSWDIFTDLGEFCCERLLNYVCQYLALRITGE